MGGRLRSGWRGIGGLIRGEFPAFLLEGCGANGYRLGMAAFVLEMIPFASIACSFTNNVGAALWAADIERAIR